MIELLWCISFSRCHAKNGFLITTLRNPFLTKNPPNFRVLKKLAWEEYM